MLHAYIYIHLAARRRLPRLRGRLERSQSLAPGTVRSASLLSASALQQRHSRQRLPPRSRAHRLHPYPHPTPSQPTRYRPPPPAMAACTSLAAPGPRCSSRPRGAAAPPRPLQFRQSSARARPRWSTRHGVSCRPRTVLCQVDTCVGATWTHAWAPRGHVLWLAPWSTRCRSAFCLAVAMYARHVSSSCRVYAPAYIGIGVTLMVCRGDHG